jgi:ribosomal-protein-serine acetyltransferase
MTFENWKTDTIENMLPEEFYTLVQSNKSHIENTFPITVKCCSSLEKTEEFIQKNKRKEREKDGYYFYIRNTETHKLIGYVCVKNINKTIMKCELAYFIDQHFEGKGIISKAVAETVAFCFGTLQMNKVFICTSKINAASQRIATKLNFKKEGILREEFKNGKAILEDIVYFGLLKSEYQS